MSTAADRTESSSGSSSPPPGAGHVDPAFAAQRLAYEGKGLEPGDLAPTPAEQFRRWYDAALAASVLEPNAMTLATVDAAGAPSARTVLLKHADREGFVFFTNHLSRKGLELAARPVAALVLVWLPLHRQVGVRGGVSRVDDAATAEYFGTRPWGSRIGAWASHQSRPVDSRTVLEERWAEFARRWPDRGRFDDVPVPPHWGGYLVRPSEVEFWQGRTSRLHDRLVYLPAAPESRPVPFLDDPEGWRVERREP
jgi:pyridoxamine 5'-phosphate oxidase